MKQYPMSILTVLMTIITGLGIVAGGVFLGLKISYPETHILIDPVIMMLGWAYCIVVFTYFTTIHYIKSWIMNMSEEAHNEHDGYQPYSNTTKDHSKYAPPGEE